VVQSWPHVLARGLGSRQLVSGRASDSAKSQFEKQHADRLDQVLVCIELSPLRHRHNNRAATSASKGAPPPPATPAQCACGAFSPSSSTLLMGRCPAHRHNKKKKSNHRAKRWTIRGCNHLFVKKLMKRGWASHRFRCLKRRVASQESKAGLLVRSRWLTGVRSRESTACSSCIHALKRGRAGRSPENQP